MKKSGECDFDEKVEKAVEKVMEILIQYLNKKAHQQKGYALHNNECVIDKLVEKEKLMSCMANIFTELAKITANQLIEPIKQAIDQLETDLGKIKELLIKSFSEVTKFLIQFTPAMRSVGVSEKVIENGKQVEMEEIDRLRKKLQNHDNMISLLMDTQAQMKQAISIFSSSDDIQQSNKQQLFLELLSQFDDRIYQLKQELNDTKVSDTVRQIREKSNACWVVLGDINTRVEKMQNYIDDELEKKKSGGLLKKAASYIKSS